MAFDTPIVMMLGSKAPNHDAYGLFRALHSHNPAQGLSTTYEQAHVVLGLLTSTMMPADCSVLCTPTILSNIRISWD